MILNTIKELFFLIIVYCISISVCFGQLEVREKFEKLKALRFAILDNSTFHFFNGFVNQNHFVSINLDDGESPNITIGSAADFPIYPECWAYRHQFFFAIDVWGNLGYEQVHLSKYPKNLVDSIAQEKIYENVQQEKSKIIYESDDARMMAAFDEALEAQKAFNERFVLPVRLRNTYLRMDRDEFQFKTDQEYLDKFAGKISFDISVINDSLVLLYYRDDEMFTIYKFHYPPLGVKSKDSDWKLIDNYALKNSTMRGFSRPNILFPSPEKTHFHAIADTSFFYGHFKVIRQKGNYFIINQHHGAIYYLGKNTIDKVGQIALEEQRFTLWGQKTFIEDLDKGELLFFTSVQQLGKPFPKIKVMTEEKAFREKFRLVPK